MEMKIKAKSCGRRMGDVLPLRYMLDKNRANKKEKKEILRDWKTKIEIQRDWESEKDKEEFGLNRFDLVWFIWFQPFKTETKPNQIF